MSHRPLKTTLYHWDTEVISREEESDTFCLEAHSRGGSTRLLSNVLRWSLPLPVSVYVKASDERPVYVRESVCVCSFFYTCRTSGDAYSWIRESATVAWRKIAFQVVASSECVQRKRRKRMRWRRREKSVLSESLSWPTCGLHFCKIACPAQRDKIAWTRIEFRVSAVQGRAGTAVAKTQRTSGNETEREG